MNAASNFKAAREAVKRLGDMAENGGVKFVMGATFREEPRARKLATTVSALIETAIAEGINIADISSVFAMATGFMVGQHIDHTQPDAGLAVDEAVDALAKITRAVATDAFAQAKKEAANA